ncbi:MAG: hypothetical protein A3E87_09330 [Gammaproteobacteria bacterium RIFCSPHIGHO2_12_FULL_35_23]|nr:MAG: hypothetical protein A3E87_09330 [Gammaproteobacteria bacterium RIFCSPHIGHO2_12_FULL_35_23]
MPTISELLARRDLVVSPDEIETTDFERVLASLSNYLNPLANTTAVSVELQNNTSHCSLELTRKINELTVGKSLGLLKYYINEEGQAYWYGTVMTYEVSGRYALSVIAAKGRILASAVRDAQRLVTELWNRDYLVDLRPKELLGYQYSAADSFYYSLWNVVSFLANEGSIRSLRVDIRTAIQTALVAREHEALISPSPTPALPVSMRPTSSPALLEGIFAKTAQKRLLFGQVEKSQRSTKGCCNRCCIC